MSATAHLVEYRSLIDAIDAHDAASRRVVARGAVLSRLFESLQDVAFTRRIDFGRVREAEFWDGLRLITEDIIADTATMKQAAESLYSQGGSR